MWERESVCVRERNIEIVCVLERDFVSERGCVCERECERECVRERESVCGRVCL